MAVVHQRDKMTPRERVLEAVIGLADCDDGDETAYRACWERLRAACMDWLNPGRRDLSRERVGYAFRAFEALREALSSQQLAKRVGICHRSSQELVAVMKAAGLPVREEHEGRKIVYRLDGVTGLGKPKPVKRKGKVIPLQLELCARPSEGMDEHDEAPLPLHETPLSEWPLEQYPVVGPPTLAKEG
jgi:hypothetical protein